MVAVTTIEAELRGARQNRTLVKPLSERVSGFSVQQGYEVQSLSLKRDLEGGNTLSGFKMGLTSLAKQRDVNVSEPICGYLLKQLETPTHVLSSKNYRQLRIEPEVAVQVGDVSDPRSLESLKKAILSVRPAYELLDSRFENFRFSLPDVVADNASAAGYGLGTSEWKNDLANLRLYGVIVLKNGEICETGAPVAVLGDPLISLQALFPLLETRGLKPFSGMWVLTGGITASIPIQKGDEIEMRWPTEKLTVRVEE